MRPVTLICSKIYMSRLSFAGRPLSPEGEAIREELQKLKEGKEEFTVTKLVHAAGLQNTLRIHKMARSTIRDTEGVVRRRPGSTDPKKPTIWGFSEGD